MLAVHILNVNHGDSIVLEHRDEGIATFAVVDSNLPAGVTQPPALKKLQQLGAERLSFVALTHPHADHYMGLSAVLREFHNRVGNVFTFPVKEHRKKIAKLYQAKLDVTDGDSIGRQAEDFIEFLLLANQCEWEDAPASPINFLAPEGFNGVRISSILPPAKQKGEFFESLRKNKFQPELENEMPNGLSLAFLLEYKGHRIILGGDGTYSNWMYQNNRIAKAKENFHASAVKLPHHGSKYDCGDAVLKVFFDKKINDGPSKFACISADGKTHPHPDVIDGLVDLGVKPYCTNLAKRCGGKFSEMFHMPNVEAAMGRFIYSVIAKDTTSRSIQPCQGDITIQVNDGGAISVIPQHNHPCTYRGDFDFVPPP